MPILRTYQCGECFHRIEVTLSLDDWEAPPPDCPACAQRQMAQEFKPINIGGSHRAKAVALAEKIAAEDYGVADMHIEGKEGVRNKVRYKDQGTPAQHHQASSWSGDASVLATAMAHGRETRLKHGDGLHVLQGALKSGAQPDLIEASKRRAMKVW